MTVLLTGATGFVGMEVLYRLLERGEDEVLALVRGPDAPRRLHAALDTMGVDRRRRGDVTALDADLTAPGADLRRTLPRRIDAIVHCAASIAFDLELDEARRINVGGTDAMVQLARRTGARLVHVSTAYVGGRHRGRFGEDDLWVGQGFRNTYEQSKLEAELLVRDANDVDSVVLRPSIVMGESGTGWTPAFNVLYWPLRAFSRGLVRSVAALPAGRVDVVPVDVVADAIAHVTCERRDVRGTLHLVAGEHAATVDELLDLAAEAFGRPRPVLATAGGDLADRSAEAAQYLPYFDIETVFGDERARAVLGPAGIAVPPLRDYFATLVAFAQDARWGKAPLARTG